MPLIFNTDWVVFFDTALHVLCSVTLSKRRVVPKYARTQNSRISAHLSNMHMSLTMFTEVTSLFLRQSWPVFKKLHIILYNYKNIGLVIFMWYENIPHSSWKYHTCPTNLYGIFMTCALYFHITLKAIQYYIMIKCILIEKL